MGVTIHVNGKSNSLVHKGSTGIAKSTIPDICKTPSPGGPVPIPYPVIVSMSSDLKKGTKKVKVDGKNPAAIKGSEFSRCVGDEPGTVGGIKSSTNMKEATWLLYSFDVKLEGKNACRLSDKMLMNHGNTVCLGGEVQIPVIDEDIEGCKQAEESADKADELTPEHVKEESYVVAGSNFKDQNGMASSGVSAKMVLRGGKYKDFAKGLIPDKTTKMYPESNVPCPSKKSGKHEYPARKGSCPKQGHAEAKIIEDLFAAAKPGTPKGKLYLKVKGKPICTNCRDLIDCAEENEGLEVFVCP